MQANQLRRKSAIRYAIWAILLSSLSTATGLCADPSEQGVQSRLSEADSARLDLEQRLKSANATGTLSVNLQESSQPNSLQLTDATIELHYDSPKFCIKIVNRTRLRAKREDDKQWALPWLDAGVGQELILFDGEALYHAQWDRDNNCTGEIYFAFARQAVLRSAGFPFEHPVYIWKDALNISRVKPSRTEITPLVGGGFKAVETMTSYDTKFFIFDKFGYDLRRVSTQRTDNGIPIREYNLRWDTDGKIHYLTEFMNTVTKTRVNPVTDEAEVISKLTTKVAYDSFTANQTVAPNHFKLSEQKIPLNTIFVDKRRTTRRNNTTLIFDGTKLVEQAEEAAK